MMKEGRAIMNGREIMEIISLGRIPPRIPFVPTIYEHAAKILNVTPSKMAKDADLIVDGQIAAYELYRHDMISVGLDIYNIEAESIGCRVIYYEDDRIPTICGTIISSPNDLRELMVPEPSKTGRMPLFIESSRRINEKIGDKVPVCGTIVGPFTLTAIIRGFENLLMDLIFDEEFAMEQLKFSCNVVLSYAKAFIASGVGVVINESWIAAPFLSPKLFKEKVFGIEKNLINQIKAKGLKNVAFICGGNTTPIYDYLVQTGASLLMADANTDQRAYKKLCEKYNINLRVSIESSLVEKGIQDEMEEAVVRIIDSCAENGRFIFGCGIVSYNTPPENILKLKMLIEKHNPYKALY